ncbi:MAG: hypothetical protein ABI616_02895 [Pseudomonadota bacterium]
MRIFLLPATATVRHKYQGSGNANNDGNPSAAHRRVDQCDPPEDRQEGDAESNGSYYCYRRGKRSDGKWN